MTAANEIMQPLLERFYREMNISVYDVVNMDSDLETTATPTDAEILGLPSCAPSASDKSENEDNCGDELERVTQSEVTSCLEKLNVYIMQASCNESMNYAKKQTKITSFFTK